MDREKSDGFFGDDRATIEWPRNPDLAPTAAPVRSAGTIDASKAGVLAAEWRSPIRRATVPLLPQPLLEEDKPAASTAIGGVSYDLADVPEPVQTPRVAAALPTATTQRSDERPRSPLTLIILIILILIVLVLGPAGENVSFLQPMHDFLTGLLPHVR